MKHWVLAVWGFLALICISKAVPLSSFDDESSLRVREARSLETGVKETESLEEEEKKEEKEDQKEEDRDDDKEADKEEKEEQRDDKEEDKEVQEQENDQEEKDEGDGKGKIKGVAIEEKERDEKEKDDDEEQPEEDETREEEDNKDDSENASKRDKTEKAVQAKRCGGFGLYGNEGCCGQWSDPAQESATGCSNCCGGFGSPISCGCGGCGGCSTLNFPCTFGACVNNPCCECCKEKPPKGKCQWPCYWPCCCECTPPQFKFKPLEAKPLCHCNQGSNGGGKRDSTKKRSIKTRRCGCGGPFGGFGYGSPWSQNFGYGFGYPFPFGGNWGFLYPYHF